MIFGTREGKLNKRLEKQVVSVIEGVIHAPLHDMLAVCATSMADLFETRYTCIHFTKDFGLSWEASLPALKYCPVATVDEQSKDDFLAIEDQLNSLAVNSGTQVHHAELPVERWHSFMGHFGLNSGLSVPLKYQEETFGVMDIYHKKKIDFKKIDTRPLLALGSCLYGAVKKEVMIKTLEERDDIIEAFARTIEASDRYTGGHVDRVSQYALLIGGLLKLDSEDIKSLKRASLLHDIGKVGVSDSILNKPGPLTPDERAIMEKHPVIAQDILGPVTDPGLQRALDGILYHHERIDGKGYPFRLAGEDIPLIARIIAIADTYDALTSDRPYRRGMDIEKATAILKDCRGTQLDALLVDLFLEHLTLQ